MNNNDTLRQMQLSELKMLKEAIAFFEENDITYYAIGGTLLGAVRHKGFIPWDDDVDLGIPREDYDRWIDMVKKGQCPLKVTGPWDDQLGYWYPARIESEDTQVRRFVHNEEVLQFIWIDVFPLDGVPSSLSAQKKYWNQVSFRRLRFNLSRLKKYEASENKAKNVLKKILMLFMNPEKMDIKKEYQKYDNAMKKYGFQGQPCFINAEGRCEMREIAPQAWMGKEGLFLPFEDTQIHCFEHYDEYLTQIYGDYMQPPKNPNLYEHNIKELIVTKR